MNKFKISPLVAAMSALTFAAAAQYSYAQEGAEAPSLEEEEVVVTGFRRTLLNAIDAKRNADTQIEAISAEDIGGLPDVSIADSLARLPGITTERTGGQAGSITIRGMGGDFVFSTLNGREQVSPSNSRVIEFNQYPAELLTEVAVYKSPKASLIEGGVAGTVELRTANPLEMSQDHKFNVNLRGSFNDRAEQIDEANDYGTRFSFAYQGKFAEDTVGLSLGYAYLDQPKVAAQFLGLSFEDSTTLPENPNAGYQISNGFEIQQTGGTETRHGYVGALQYEPIESLSIQADLFYTEFTSDSFAKGFRVQPLNGASYIHNPTVVDGRVITSGVYVDGAQGTIDVQMISDDSTDDDDVLSTGLNVKWEGEVFTAAYDYSFSKADGYQADGIIRAHLYERVEDAEGNPVLDDDGEVQWVRDQDIAINLQYNGTNLPNIQFNDNADFTDRNKVRVTNYERYPRINSDQVEAHKVDFKYQLDMPVLESLEAGVRVSEREYENSRGVFRYGQMDNDRSVALNASNSNVVNWQGDFDHFPDFLNIDGDAVINYLVENNLVVYDNGLQRPVNPRPQWREDPLQPGEYDTSWSVLQGGDVLEEVTAYYFMANFGAELGGINLTGNLGVRVVETEQSASTYINVAGDPTRQGTPIVDANGIVNTDFLKVRQGVDYTDTLPSLNLNFEITDSDVIRFAAAKVMSRAPINQLSGQAETGGGAGFINTANPEEPVFEFGNSNSPFLEPFQADQISLSYEHYFEETEGAFSVAYFYNDVQSFIQETTINNLPLDTFRELGFTVPDQVTVTIAGVEQSVDLRDTGVYRFVENNQNGGYIQGVELSYTQTLTFLPEPFSGLGFSAHYSWNDSEITVENEFSTIDAATLPYPGLAENSGAITLFWEIGAFEVRSSTRYQDSKAATNASVFGGNIINDAETVTDFQMSYGLDNGVDILFQVQNVTDEPQVSYWGAEAFTGNVQYFGRQFFLGASYSF